FVVPELCEIKTDRSGPAQAAGFYLLDEPGQAPIHSCDGARAGVEQDFHGQGGFFQAGGDAGSSSPAAVRVLSCEQPGDATPGGFAVHHMEVAVSGQDAGGAVGRVLVAGGVLVAEPERQPGTVGALLLREIS